MITNKYWTREHLREVMDDFSADFKNKKYSEKIEYELWRKIRNVKTPIISYNNTVRFVKESSFYLVLSLSILLHFHYRNLKAHILNRLF